MNSSNYNFKVSNPNCSNNIPQMKSDGFQVPFYFGGSQVKEALGNRIYNETPIIQHIKKYKK